MKELTMIIRPEKLETVKMILDVANCHGMTVSNAMGYGTQRGFTEDMTNLVGQRTVINLLPKIKVEVVVEDDQVEEIIIRIREKLSTGVVGDGKIFIKNIEDVVRIRTGERGEKAL